MSLNVVFLGTAEVSAVVFSALLTAPDVTLVGVLTPPDRARGRGRRPSPCQVKAMALEAGLPVCDPERVNTPETLATVIDWHPDLVVVVAYGQFLGAKWLDLPPLGCLNVHLSLLPALRGAAPVQWAILNGLSETGVTVMRMDRGMDSGDVLSRRSLVIGPDETAGALQARLASLGAALLVETLPAWRDGILTPRPQDAAQASLAPKLTKNDGWLDWRLPAATLAHRVRALQPWPGCYTLAPGGGTVTPHRLGILAAAADTAADPPDAAPGEVCSVAADGLLVACGRGMLRVLEVQPEGRNAMPVAAYLRGRPVPPGIVFGGP